MKTTDNTTQQSTKNSINNGMHSLSNMRISLCNKLINTLLILATILAVINFLSVIQFRLTELILAIITIVILCGLVPLKYRCTPTTQLKIFCTTLTATTILTEMSITDSFEANTSIFIVLPIVLAVILLATDFTILFKQNKSNGYFITLMYCTIIASLPLIVMLATNNEITNKGNQSINYVLYSLPLINLIAIFLVKPRYAIGDLKRIFHM